MNQQEKTTITVQLPVSVLSYIDKVAYDYGVKRPAAISIIVNKVQEQQAAMAAISEAVELAKP